MICAVTDPFLVKAFTGIDIANAIDTHDQLRLIRDRGHPEPQPGASPRRTVSDEHPAGREPARRSFEEEIAHDRTPVRPAARRSASGIFF